MAAAAIPAVTTFVRCSGFRIRNPGIPAHEQVIGIMLRIIPHEHSPEAEDSPVRCHDQDPVLRCEMVGGDYRKDRLLRRTIADPEDTALSIAKVFGHLGGNRVDPPVNRAVELREAEYSGTGRD